MNKLWCKFLKYFCRFQLSFTVNYIECRISEPGFEREILIFEVQAWNTFLGFIFRWICLIDWDCWLCWIFYSQIIVKLYIYVHIIYIYIYIYICVCMHIKCIWSYKNISIYETSATRILIYKVIGNGYIFVYMYT